MPAPIASTPNAIAIERRSPHDPSRSLVLVSLGEKLREYYLRTTAHTLTPLDDLTWAEWHPLHAGQLVATTSTGHLAVLNPEPAPAPAPVWTYDMNKPQPTPTPTPGWAHHWP